MTTQDAANLLIGANAVQSPSEAGEAVAVFRPMTPLPRRASREQTHPTFRALTRCKTFGEAVETLITSSPKYYQTFSLALEEARPTDLNLSDEEKLERQARLEIEALGMLRLTFRSAMMPQISFWNTLLGFPYQFITITYIHPLPFDSEDAYERHERLGQAFVDRRVTVQIGLRTFLSVNAALFDPVDRDKPKAVTRLAPT